MQKLIDILVFVLLACGPAAGQYPFTEILAQVESNNPELGARRKLRDAQTAGSRVSNSPEDPSIEYVHQWGRPSSAGPAGELTVMQTFDFPTVYTNRARLSDARIAVYGHEYEAYRQEILFQAQTLCIEALALREKQRYLRRAMEDAGKVAAALSTKSAAGSANALEENKARFEYITAANAYKMNEIELSEVMSGLEGLSGGYPVALPDTPLDWDAGLRTLDEMLSVYESLSPQMLAAMAGVEAAKRDIGLSRSRSIPKFAVGYRHDFTPGEKLNGIVAGVTIPLFSNRHNVRRAQAEAAWAQAEVNRTRNDLRTTLTGLYARAELLKASSDQYRRLLDYGDSVALLSRALEEGHISVVDYYSQLQPVYEGYLSMVDILAEYYLVCARINAVLL